MVVRFVISTRRPLGQMANQTVSSQFKLSDAHAGAFSFSPVDARRLNVGDEVSFPNMLQARLIALLPLVKETIRSRITVGKIVRAIENKFFVVNHVHHEWRVGDGEILYRRAGAVSQAAPGIEWGGGRKPR